MEPILYRGITPTHGLTGCTDRTMSSVGGVVRGLPRVSVCVGHNVLQGEGLGRENREPGAEMDEEEEAEEEGDFNDPILKRLNGVVATRWTEAGWVAPLRL